jgi:hypothetical protein
MRTENHNKTHKRRHDGITVRLPGELPTLTPQAARILLQIIVEISRRQHPTHGGQTQDDAR